MEWGHNSALTRRYSYQYLLSRSGVEIHLPGEQCDSPYCEVELVLCASVCWKPE